MRFRIFAIIFFLLALLQFDALPLAAQATITVNTTADNTTAGDGNCTLREAFRNANGNTDLSSGDCTAGTSSGIDTIEFNIAGAGPHTITVTGSGLPALTSPVFIDGLSQPGADCQTELMIIVNGASFPGGVGIGLQNGASGSTVRGIVANGFANNTGIGLNNGDNIHLYCNFVGTNSTGTAAVPNFYGFLIAIGSDNNVFGTNGDGVNDANERNLISGNNTGVVFLDPTDSFNRISGNLIGTDITGTLDLGNSQFGVSITDSANNNIIGTNGDGNGDDVEGNVISGNNTHGISLGNGDNNIIAGNLIGTDITGTLDLGNTSNGINISSDSTGNLIGTDGDGISDEIERNIISANDGSGIFVAGINSQISGNYIGTTITGNSDLGNTSYGVNVDNTSNAIIGTNGDGNGDDVEGNVISGNNLNGILFTNADSNTIAGNFIGSDSTGSSPIANSSNGIQLNTGSTDNIIGTDGDGLSDALEGNLVSGNTGIGISLSSDSSGNEIAGNLIGTDITGNLAMGNTSIGIQVQSANNRIGTNGDGVSDDLEGNLISGNNSTGIQISNGDNSIVAGNLIGTNLAGTAALPNSGFGISVQSGSTGSTIGTNGDGVSDDLEGNLISGNTSVGIFFSSNSGSNILAGNFIGTDITGTLDLGNGIHGVNVSSSLNRIGTNGDGLSDALEGNLISGNDGNGIQFDGSTATNNTAAGNIIGLNASASNPIGNASTGLTLQNSANNNTIGGALDAQSNVIGGNGTNGINIQGANTTNNIINNNYIGTNAALANLGNNANGIRIVATGTNTTSVSNNWIFYNSSRGIFLSNAASLGAAGVSENNCLWQNSAGVNNSTGVNTFFENNWWGSSTGPSGVGTGGGDSVSANVDYSPFLTVAPTGCPSLVTVTATDTAAAENPLDTGTFTFDLGVVNSTGVAITVNYTITGTATNGTDYSTITASIDIPNGSQTVTLTITPTDDFDIEAAETVILTLTSTNNAGFDVDVTPATVTIADDDVAGILVTPTSIAIAEGGATATFDISTTVNASSTVSVPVTADGQCTVSANPVLLPAGSMTPVTVTVTAVDDLDVEGAHTCAITVGDPGSTDTNFDALVDADTADVTANVTDNDTAGILVAPTSIAIAEGGATATFDISTTVNSTSTVSVPVTTDGQCTVSANPVILPAGSTAPVTVTVTAVDDLDVEGAHSCAITVGDPGSTDTNFDALTDTDTADVTANVTDNDTAGILVAPTTIAIAEGGATATFDISTTVNSTSTVSIPVTTDGQCTVSANPVLLPAGSTAPVTVTVTAVDDLDVEGAHTCAITVGDPGSTDTNFDALVDADTADVTANVTDNDTAAILVAPTSIAIAEGGTTATFDISTTVNSTSTVSIPVTTDGQCTVSANPVILPAGSTAPVTVTVTAVDDLDVEGAHTCAITVGDPGSTDTNFDALTDTDTADVTANVTDNDTAGILVAPTSIAIAEGGATATFDISTSVNSTSTVSIPVTTDGQCTVSANPVLLPAGSTAPVTVTVTAVDDLDVEGAHTCAITVGDPGSTDTNFDALTDNDTADVTANVTDNDTAGILVAPTSIAIAEGGTTATFDISSSTNTSATIDVAINTDGQCLLSTVASPVPSTSLTVTLPAGSSTVVTVTVEAVDDSIAEGAHSCIITTGDPTSADANYDALVAADVADVTANVTDNDTAGISLAIITVTEGAAGLAMDVVLLSEPTGDVTISLSPDTQCTLSTTTLTFTDSAGANPWDVPQTVTVTAVDDAFAEGAHICVVTYSATSTDANYTIGSTTHDVDVVDNDTPGISLATITVTEGAAGVTMDIVLFTEPTGDVTITLASDAQCSLSTTSLSFTDSAGASPWDVPQTVTVTAVDDAFAEGAHICVVTYSATSTDANYTIGSTTHDVDVVDNDTPGVLLVPTGGGTSISEAGLTDTIEITLATEPTGDVTITLTSNAQCTLSVTTITFTDSAGANPWDVPQTVTVTAVDDTAVEGAHTCLISYTTSSADTDYDLLTGSITANIADNDRPTAPVATAEPNITVFDPAISKLGILLPGQLGVTGERLDWVVTVTNNGTAAGTNVVVSDTLRPELSIIGVSFVTGTGNSVINGQTVTVTIPTLAVGQSVVFTIATEVTAGVSVDNTACVSASNLANQRCVTALPVESLPQTGETNPWLLWFWAGLGVLAFSAILGLRWYWKQYKV